MPLYESAQIINGEPWAQTLGGGMLHLVNPRPEQINFEHVATALARVQRFACQSENGLLVAQHCEQGARAIMRDTGRVDIARAFLLHDAHEYVMGDIATPMMDALCIIANQECGERAHVVIRRAMKTWKQRADKAIYTAAGMEWPLKPHVAQCVREYDLRMCRTERDLFLMKPPHKWASVIEDAKPVDGIDSRVWFGAQAKTRWLTAFRDLC